MSYRSPLCDGQKLEAHTWHLLTLDRGQCDFRFLLCETLVNTVALFVLKLFLKHAKQK